MKFAKIVKNTATLTLIGASAMGIYVGIKSKELLIEATEMIDGLQQKIANLNININLLSEQIDEIHSEKIINKNDASESADEKLTNDQSEFIYTLRFSNNMIGIFDQEDKLVKEESIRPDDLPTPEKENLKIGIRVRSEKELNEFLSDLRRISVAE
jgi:hypothetical protein